ncbi:MetQ/NlpA family ABC transporter substrate-binding protein [Pseudomonas oryzihabitans]|uniref:MetQ/NlpA family ABC transporter substrate-binding protein n=1 Tax=Pseudomonas oryzihabitans TaxID=47885 RepID=UPI002861162E|nr:MetQ/NlpA family ABC transporter substrate-binding protein [Pseudomonas psychrotolerans]MDR6680364.1 D-methionine transport system substrate-binding protein [Pseudomonas psychrotolerans]
MTRLKPLLFALGLLSSTAFAAPLKIGTTAAFAQPLEVAVQQAKAAGVDVELVEFNDWIAPNTSLANHDIDANYYQHIPFLENANRNAGYNLVPVAPGILTNVGLYSKKYQTLAEVPKGARVAIANDAINGGRGLLLLQKAGFITLKPGVGYHATVADITSNPRDIQIVEVEAVNLARTLDDVDVAQGYPHYLRLANTIDPNQALLFDGLDHPEYVIQFVARPDNKDDPRLAKLIDLYQHSPKVRAALDQAHGKLYQPGWTQ